MDYIYNKHYDAYVGLNWSEVTDGLANGFRALRLALPAARTKQHL